MIAYNYTAKRINRLKSKENALKSKGIAYNNMQRKNCTTTKKTSKDKCNNTIKGKRLVLSSYCIITYIT